MQGLPRPPLLLLILVIIIITIISTIIIIILIPILIIIIITIIFSMILIVITGYIEHDVRQVQSDDQAEGFSFTSQAAGQHHNALHGIAMVSIVYGGQHHNGQHCNDASQHPLIRSREVS